MKNFRNLILFAAFIGFFVACNSESKADKAEVSNAAKAAQSDGASIAVNTANSIINWAGTAVGKKHTGTLSISDGNVKVENGKVSSGNFTINMGSIKNTDLPADQGGGKLEGHLKSPDFFDVGVYPDAKFEITKVTALNSSDGSNAMVYGNLTLKDVTKQIGFKAKIDVAGNKVSVDVPNFLIDRTDFNVKYGSNKFFDDLKDKAINDKIELSIKLTS